MTKISVKFVFFSDLTLLSPLDALFRFIVEVKERGLVLHYLISDPHTGGFVGTQLWG